MANRQLKNLRNIILHFCISEFSVFWLEDKTKNSGLKISEVSQFSTLAILYVCDMNTHNQVTPCVPQVSHLTLQRWIYL